MARERDEATVTIPVSLLSEMQETATKAAASGARVATTLVRLADQGARQEDLFRRALALAEETVETRVAAARQEGFDSGLAQGRAEAPASRAFSQSLAAAWADPLVRKTLVALVVATLAVGTAALTYTTAQFSAAGVP